MICENRLGVHELVFVLFVLDLDFGRRGDGGQIQFCGLLVRQLVVAESANDFQDFAACREHPSRGVLVVIHGPHELDFLLVVISLASRWIDMTTTLLLASMESS